MSDWRHKDCWKRAGKDFLVEVTRHSGEPLDSFEGAHRWAVYAYVYPKHPYFEKFEGPHMWQGATSAMPLHGGASLLEYPMYEGKVTSVKVGADYNHLHDQDYTHMATKEQAGSVFEDAEELFRWLTERAASVEGAKP